MMSYEQLISKQKKIDITNVDNVMFSLVLWHINHCCFYLMPNPAYAHIVSNVGDHSRGRPEGSLFNSYYTKV